MKINTDISVSSFIPKIDRMWELSAQKLTAMEQRYDRSLGSPVYTK